MCGYTIYESPLGRLTLASDGENLTGLWMEGQKYFGSTMPETAREQGDLPVLEETGRWLNRYFAGKRPEPSELPLKPEGSAFRQVIWKLLCQIPYGEVTTYGALAKQAAAWMGRPSMSGQAVGGAVGHNPISIIIPCHRVVGTGGSLTGYAGGIEKKIRLLELEGVDVSGLFIPKKGTAL
ncbi:MAG TPA: methylated-DNA--[protein]-cysteine S-methyltransferase [Candidatus Lachnoclostridium stercorigallinarum]|uniref:Methylated-DNA--protein-cysteine methyltransferase n=1 Tax=Candidatus Lachnoclostridium stercorigallinarum TaxID=2838634 RepID=A0A9D2GJ73_9FIRM|nr:methylated-DNA--[protein]-cysteine S-methyltransferase [Candidatus Lachnoclostridium stercorigallinarum]